MKKRWVYLLIFVAAAVLALGSWNWYQDRSLVAARTNHLASPTEVSLEQLPSIDSQRLLADVEALSFERYSEADRVRTREYITAALEQAGWEPELQEFAGRSARGINIAARRSGTEAEAGTVVLAAHYDTVEQSPGADDNATSVATVLEAARLLANFDTPRTLELVLFDLEETGLEGSTAYVEQLPQDHTLQAAIVLDMIGYACHTAGCQSYPPLPITPPTDRGDFLGIIADQKHSYILDRFAQPASSLPQVLTLSIPTFGRLTPDLMRSDHVPFWRKGIGAVLVTDTANFRNPNYHQSSDTVDTLDQDFFVGAAQIVVNATISLLVN